MSTKSPLSSFNSLEKQPKATFNSDLTREINEATAAFWGPHFCCKIMVTRWRHTDKIEAGNVSTDHIFWVGWLQGKPPWAKLNGNHVTKSHKGVEIECLETRHGFKYLSWPKWIVCGLQKIYNVNLGLVLVLIRGWHIYISKSIYLYLDDFRWPYYYLVNLVFGGFSSSLWWAGLLSWWQVGHFCRSARVKLSRRPRGLMRGLCTPRSGYHWYSYINIDNPFNHHI